MRLVIKAMALSAAVVLGVGLNAARAQHGHDHGDGGHADQGHGSHDTGSALPKCPVMGEPINFAVSVASDAGPVFFCCKDCISKYQANPSKYAGKVEVQRNALATREKVQTTCPVTSEPVDQKVYVESAGEKVYFCCQGCVKKYQRNPETYRASLANSYTYQTKCPVMGEEIDPQSFSTTAKGQKIYFCCKGCDKKLFENPAEYVSNLAGQGLAFKPAELKRAEEHEHASHGHGG